MSSTIQYRSWLSLCSVHARWVLRTTWRNGEQLLLVVGLPLAAFLALTRTDLLSTTTPALIITSVMVILATGFTSPAITVAFDRRYGSFAFLGTTPLPRSAIVVGSLAAIVTSTVVAVGALVALATAFGIDSGISVALLFVTVVVGLLSVVPWAFVLGGTVRSETVLVIANGIFVLATLFGGVLVPANSLPYGALLAWVPTGAMIELATSGHVASFLVLAVWGLVGGVLAMRLFRWR